MSFFGVHGWAGIRKQQEALDISQEQYKQLATFHIGGSGFSSLNTVMCRWAFVSQWHRLGRNSNYVSQ